MHSQCTGSNICLIVSRERTRLEADKQQVKSCWILPDPTERLAENDNSTMCFLQLQDLLWRLQSQLDQARHDAAAYKKMCFQQTDQLQASEKNARELQQDLNAAKSQMTSLQSSSIAAEKETFQLKLSENRVEKALQASEVPYSFCADLHSCNVSG